MNVTVRHGHVSSRIISPTPKISNLIRSVVPRSAREYDAGTGTWVIFASQVNRLLTTLREHGFDVIETGGPT